MLYVFQQDAVFTFNTTALIWKRETVSFKRVRGPRLLSGQSFTAFQGLVLAYGGRQEAASAGGLLNEQKIYRKGSTSLRIFDPSELAWSEVATDGARGGAPRDQLPDPLCPSSSKSGTDRDFSGTHAAAGGWNCPRYGHGATLVNNRLIVFGGSTNRDPRSNVVDKCYLKDVQVNSCLSSLPERTLHRIYVCIYICFLPNVRIM